jgi:hypothetical protein
LRCADAQKQSSKYLDSELSPERSAAVRGHLRTCDSCREIFEKEREIIETCLMLPTLDPPDAVWEAIQQRIANEEVKDSMEWPLGRWLRFRWRPLVGVGMVTAMAGSLLIARAQTSETSSSPDSSALAISASPPAKTMEASYEEARIEELAEADRHYIETIASLREMLEEDRPAWEPEQAALVDARLSAFRKDAIGTRLAIESGSFAVQGRDTLYANYRSEIGFLQSALAGDIPKGQP